MGHTCKLQYRYSTVTALYARTLYGKVNTEAMVKVQCTGAGIATDTQCTQKEKRMFPMLCELVAPRQYNQYFTGCLHEYSTGTVATVQVIIFL